MLYSLDRRTAFLSGVPPAIIAGGDPRNDRVPAPVPLDRPIFHQVCQEVQDSLSKIAQRSHNAQRAGKFCERTICERADLAHLQVSTGQTSARRIAKVELAGAQEPHFL